MSQSSPKPLSFIWCDWLLHRLWNCSLCVLEDTTLSWFSFCLTATSQCCLEFLLFPASEMSVCSRHNLVPSYLSLLSLSGSFQPEIHNITLTITLNSRIGYGHAQNRVVDFSLHIDFLGLPHFVGDSTVHLTAPAKDSESHLWIFPLLTGSHPFCSKFC